MYWRPRTSARLGRYPTRSGLRVSTESGTKSSVVRIRGGVTRTGRCISVKYSAIRSRTCAAEISCRRRQISKARRANSNGRSRTSKVATITRHQGSSSVRGGSKRSSKRILSQIAERLGFFLSMSVGSLTVSHDQSLTRSDRWPATQYRGRVSP